MSSPALRILVSAVLLSSWLILLFMGSTLGGAIYLLLIGSLALFPWKTLRS